MITVQLPCIQRSMGNVVAKALQEKLGTKVEIGKINLGFFNRIIIDDILIYDQQQKKMLQLNRLSARPEILPLTKGKIAISSAQVFGIKADLYKQSYNEPTNYQFIIDSLSSKDTTHHTPLDINVNSFIIRHSSVNYNQFDIAPTPGRFNIHHINAHDISAHIILKTLTDDSLNVKVKRLALKEKSGLFIKSLAFFLTANKHSASICNFEVNLPQSYITIDSAKATFTTDRIKETLKYNVFSAKASITPSDIASLVPQLKYYNNAININTTLNGTTNHFSIPKISVKSNNGDITLIGNGTINTINPKVSWTANIEELAANKQIISYFDNYFTNLPAPIMKIGDVRWNGSISNDKDGTLSADGDLTTDIGAAKATLMWSEDNVFSGIIKTDGINIKELLDNNNLGTIAADIKTAGKISKKKLNTLTVTGSIPVVDYDGKDYHNISIDAEYNDNKVKGWINIDDTRLHAHAEADVKATTINDAVGTISITDLWLPEKDFNLNFLRLESGYEEDRHKVKLYSDFARAEITGQFDFTTLAHSTANIIRSKLPTLPGLPTIKENTNNNFSINLKIAETEWLRKFAGIDLSIDEPIAIDAMVNDRNHQLNIVADIPEFTYEGKHYCEGNMTVVTPSDSMIIDAIVTRRNDRNEPLMLSLHANAADNKLKTTINWDDHTTNKGMKGQLDAVTNLYKNLQNEAEAHIEIQPSPFIIDGEQWNIEAADMIYSPKRLSVNDFTISNDEQHIKINGIASDKVNDYLTVSLNKVDVEYVLNLLNFHSVDFAGKASGTASIESAFNKPQVHADLDVEQFTFQHGRMGTLSAAVNWNQQLKQIDIKAIADDGPDAKTHINGYVSPERNYIDLEILGRGTHIDFLHSFTSSFLGF